METPKDDKAFMLDPDGWPNWPILPIKRMHDEHLEIACLVESPTADGHMFFVNSNMHDLEQDLKSRKVVPTLANIDQLVAEGWMVD